MQMDTGQHTPFRQHLIDPETCIRCNTCESRCPTKAITHERNYVVDPERCNYCLRCVRPCPTGAVDHWFVVDRPYSLQEQLVWSKLPQKPESGGVEDVPDAFDGEALRLLEEAHRALGGPGRAPESATKPQVNVYTRANPAKATVTGNVRITSEGSPSDVHHVILDFGAVRFPYLEGQSVGVIPPGADQTAGRTPCGFTRSPAHAMASGPTRTTWPSRSSGSSSGMMLERSSAGSHPIGSATSVKGRSSTSSGRSDPPS
jgi:Fe-S-cluster-containing hydrogenase component 2